MHVPSAAADKREGFRGGAAHPRLIDFLLKDESSEKKMCNSISIAITLFDIILYFSV